MTHDILNIDIHYDFLNSITSNQSLEEKSLDSSYMLNSYSNNYLTTNVLLDLMTEKKPELSSSSNTSDIYMNNLIENNIYEKEKQRKNISKTNSSSLDSDSKNYQIIDNNSIFKTERKKEDKGKYLNKKRDMIKKKPGKKAEKINLRKEHSSSTYDNLQLKIQVHFQNFLINLSNDALSTEFGMDHKFGRFQNIKYSEKKNISLDNFYKFQSLPIKNIIQKEITKKFKYLNKYNNKLILDSINQKSEWLQNFFNLKYIELFELYYNKGKKLNKIVINKKDIILSEKTKTFYDLIQKNTKLKSFLFDAVERGYSRLIKFKIIDK